MGNSLSACQTPTCLTIVGKDGQQSSFPLAPNSSIMVGSAPTCTLQLESHLVSPIHCLLRNHEGTVWVQDWNTREGTFVDGQRISEETALRPGVEIRLGDFRLRVQAEEPAAPSAVVPTTSCHDAGDPVPMREDPWWDEETVELLRAEVEHLQNELSERDRRLADLTLAEDGWEDRSQPVDPAATTALVERLEDLLDELEQRDERVAAMEDLLRAADEATHAEQEERRQLEAWVTDIEQRIGRREAEWRAESESLHQRLQAVLAEREQLERHVQQLAAASEPEGAHAHEITRLTEKLHALRQQLEQGERERAVLATQLASVPQATAQPTVAGIADDSLREERLQIAQERAELARQRAELVQQRDELERKSPDRQKKPHVDSRVNDFRQHLRDIHDQEQFERQGQRGLASRVAQIWRRLEGREV